MRESDGELGIIAAKLKAMYRISFADAWIAALALQRNATLIRKDPEFKQMEEELKVWELPYKTWLTFKPKLTTLEIYVTETRRGKCM